jgi:hypothetical protein
MPRPRWWPGFGNIRNPKGWRLFSERPTHSGTPSERPTRRGVRYSGRRRGWSSSIPKTVFSSSSTKTTDPHGGRRPAADWKARRHSSRAAVREAAEELAVTRAVKPLWSGNVEFRFRGQSIRQVERYFLLQDARDDVAGGEVVEQAHRREGIVAARSWSFEEIETTSGQVFPEDLCKRLRDLRASRIHEAPSGAVSRAIAAGFSPTRAALRPR